MNVNTTWPRNALDEVKLYSSKTNLITGIDWGIGIVYETFPNNTDITPIKYTALFVESLYEKIIRTMLSGFPYGDISHDENWRNNEKDECMRFLYWLYPFAPVLPASNTNLNGSYTLQYWFDYILSLDGGSTENDLVDFRGYATGQAFEDEALDYLGWDEVGNGLAPFKWNDINPKDKAIQVAVRSDPSYYGLNCLHHVLVIGFNVFIPAGVKYEAQNAQISVLYLDPALTAQPQKVLVDEFLTLASLTDRKLTDPNVQDLLPYRCLALYLGKGNRWRWEIGARTLDQIEQLDVGKRRQLFDYQRRYDIMRKLIPILDLLGGS